MFGRTLRRSLASSRARVPARREFVRDEIGLKRWTLLANAGFGQTEIIARGFGDRLAYHGRLVSLNADAGMLLRPTEPTEVVLDLGDEEVSFELRDAIGYSSILPLTEAGYDGYVAGSLSAFEFMGEHVLAVDQVPGSPCYIYLEGLFYFPALGAFELRSEEVVLANVPPTSVPLITLHFEHMARFAPRLDFDESGRVMARAAEGVPIILCCTNGDSGDALVRHVGFETIGTDKEGLDIHQLDVADYNRLRIDDPRRQAMTVSVRALVEASRIVHSDRC